MRHYGLPEKYIRIFQAFFNGTMNAVRVNGELTDWFTVNSGTGQGDIQGPPVFNFCLNFAAYMAVTNKTASRGVVLLKEAKGVEERVVLDTDYADDIAIMDNSTGVLQESTDLLAHYSSYAGLKINRRRPSVWLLANAPPSVLTLRITTLSLRSPVNQWNRSVTLYTWVSQEVVMTKLTGI